MSPRPSSAYLNDFYANAPVYSYSSAVAADYVNIINDKIALISGFLKRFPQVPSQGLAVDFGAGNGSTVKSLSELGFEAEGVEISEKARAAAKALFGVSIHDGRIDDYETETLSFLTLFDVLEHLLEPRDFLTTLAKRLKPGGACLIGVPNFNSLDRLVLGTASKALIFPEHVNQFTSTTLRQLLELCGYRVLYVGSPPPYGVAITFGVRRRLQKALGRTRMSLGLCKCLVWIKRYIVYPLPNLFVEKTGLLGQSLLILAYKARE